MSEEIAAAAGDIAYWQRRAETAEADRDTLQAFLDALRALESCGCQLCQVIERADELLPALGQARAEAAALSDSCQAWIESEARWRHRAESAEATAAALRQAAIDLTNQLTVLRRPDESALWRLGGKPLERDYRALRDALTTDAGAAPLKELAAARDLAVSARLLLGWYFDRDPDAEPIDADDLMYPLRERLVAYETIRKEQAHVAR
jgi:hypothetical protein